MHHKYSDFGERFRKTLSKQGINERAVQERKVMEATGVTIRTARRYLSGESCPRTIDQFDKLSEGVGVTCSWLWSGEGLMTQEEMEALIKIFQMSPADRAKLWRFMMKMKNGSPRTERLMKLFDSGQLSARDLLDLA